MEYNSNTNVAYDEDIVVPPVRVHQTLPAGESREGSFGVAAEKSTEKYGYLAIKRTFDFIASLAALVVLSPFLLLIMLLIRLDSKGPALYVQERCGKNGKTFRMYKFRTMCPDADKRLEELRDKNEVDGPVFKISDDPRVTKLGRVLRKTSIDELPQLLNILKGEMSVVGPRPPLPNEVAQYTPYQMRRLDVTPGLTCYWQVKGRSNLSFDEWVELDLKYIQERGVFTDAKIILSTVPVVLHGIGAY